jgi:anti-sigma regulatory factor (Ser/Thr protein kinase)
MSKGAEGVTRMTYATTVTEINALALGIDYMDMVPVPPLDGREACMTGEWPLRSFLELGAYAGAVRCARLHAQLVTREWGFGELGDTCAFVVSELVPNAIRASRALGQFTTVRLWLFSDKGKVLILVWDASPLPPRPAADPDPLAESGRGLYLVGQSSEHWSWYYTADSGKAVWALCSEAFG